MLTVEGRRIDLHDYTFF